MRYLGKIELRSGFRLKGWCCSSNGDPATIIVHVNNILRGVFPAFLHRADLAAKGICKAGGGFEIDLTPFLNMGQNTLRITDPDGSVLDSGDFFINYRDVVLGETASFFDNVKGKSIGLFGNARFARDTSIGTCMSKILHCIGIETLDEPSCDDATRNLWHCFPHKVKPSGYSRTINFNISDISKSGIDRYHQEIFGRSVCINPSDIDANAIYVVKSERNAAHDGKIKLGSQITREDLDDAVVQRLIDNRSSEITVLDLRVPVIGKTIPHVILKTRPIGNRFSNSNTTATVTRTENVFSESEIRKIFSFCELVCLDYGELDILRDVNTGEIWIVDVNNTPAGPANGLSQSEMNFVIREQAIAFYNQFLNSPVALKR